jgi:type I restriction enzyme S subunit
MKWPYYKVSELTDRFISGGTPDTKVSEYWNGDIPWITGADFTGDGVAIGRRNINQSAVTSSATNIVPMGSILMVTRTGVGKIAIAPVDIAISQDITGIVLKQGVEAKYVLSAITSKMSSLLAVQRGATIKGITRDDVKRVVIPLPPPSEQRRIVEILDRADQLRKIRTETDKKAERILSAIFNKMFGDPFTNPMGWKLEPLGKLSLDGPQYGANASSLDWKEGMPRYVRITDIQEDGSLSDEGVCSIDMDNWEQYRLEIGDLLFARSGNTVGKTYLYDKQDGLCAYAGYLIRFKLDTQRINPWFAFVFTQTKHYKNWVVSKKRVAGQPNINAQEYNRLLFPIPPIDLQNKFGESVEQVLKLRSQRNESRNYLNSLYTLFLQQAFSGTLTATWRESHMK